MSSTILYKFRSGTAFEALPLPGTAARLFDVKRAIVKAKKLDALTGGSQLEFDLSVRNATTQEEYADESMLLPRGTRLIVQRLPAARGHGFLARMARAESGMTVAAPPRGAAAAAPSGYYTIDSRDRDEEDEFVQQSTTENKEEKEVAALLALTEGGTQSGGLRPAVTAGRVAGAPPPPPRQATGGYLYKPQHQRPNADPELRDQEQKQMPKKRATGIPRTFLNISAPPVTDGSKGPEGEEAEAVATLQPNALGFQELVNRGGGQSENTTGTRRDLDYALKLTATTIPEHLQCGICHSVVKNAMLLPWDPEGRTACETCIRDALTQNGFRCPLTGIEGVSPDDLHPNYGLRKAAELFIHGVMEKMEEIEKQQVDEETENAPSGEAAGTSGFEGDTAERGVILSKKTRKDHTRKHDDDDPFGGDTDFGGDVFDVAAGTNEADDEDVEGPGVTADTDKVEDDAIPKDTNAASVSEKLGVPQSVDQGKEQGAAGSSITSKEISTSNEPESKLNSKDAPVVDTTDVSTPAKVADTDSKSPTTESDSAPPSGRRDARRRGPPAGYAMGPAGGAAVHRGGGPYANRPTTEEDDHRRGDAGPSQQVGGRGRGFSSPPGGRGSGYHHQDRPSYRGRGRGGRHGRGRYHQGDYESGGRGGQHHGHYASSGHSGDDRYQQHEGMQQDEESRGTKRSRNGSEDQGSSDDRYRGEHSGRNGGSREWSQGGRHSDRSRGGYDSRRGPPGGRFRGGGDYGGRRGGWRGRGGGYGRGRY